MAKKNNKTNTSVADDPMSKCVALCQDEKWREAAYILKSTIAQAEADGQSEMALGMSAALPKIEYSLRRQMAAALILKSKEFLAKEYLLDVGE